MKATSRNPFAAYHTATQTVAKTRQVVMLYDGAIRCLKQAKEAIRERRIEERYNLLVRASEIVMGLQGSLDFEQGGEIAKILYGFYSSIDARIISIHRTESQEMCDQLVKELKEMRDAWDNIDNGNVATPAPAADAANAAPADGAAPANALAELEAALPQVHMPAAGAGVGVVATPAPAAPASPAIEPPAAPTASAPTPTADGATTPPSPTGGQVGGITLSA